jgi:DNA-binding CsgD family transcriptional regulator
MKADRTLDHGRVSYERGMWGEAYASLAQADRNSSLEAEDLERLAMAAYLVGRDAESAEAWTRGHQAFLEEGDVPRAVRCAFWLGSGLLRKGERARGGGWLARAQRLLEECGADCVEHGYLLLPAGLRAIMEGDGPTAYAAFCRAGEVGARFGDVDLIALSLHSRGRARLRMGDLEEGVALLDDAMVAVEVGGVSPIVAGEVYCSVIEGCSEIFDVRRAQEWTAALSHWCESQADLVAYRGQCLVRRAEILRLHGAWSDALSEAERAGDWLTRPPGERAAGAAFYEQAELHRLRGELDDAEDAYRQASRWGATPQPGLALLRHAQGDVAAAATAVRQALDEACETHVRVRRLPAHVEIMLAANDVASARASADELASIAAAIDTPLLHAVAAAANGAVLLAEDDARAALAALREAWRAWQELDAPYEAARTRALIGQAYHALGDKDTAALEFDAARVAFERVGAALDVARVAELAHPEAPKAPAGLTRRELEVLRLVASGKTNRAIAVDLFISEKTVGRHVSNIFLKLGTSTRAAATAYAYEHGLV